MEVYMDERVKQALEALKIDVPVYTWQVEGNTVRLTLYGGIERIWQLPEPPPVTEKPASPKVKRGSTLRRG
jgi:hypothetical protein